MIFYHIRQFFFYLTTSSASQARHLPQRGRQEPPHPPRKLGTFPKGEGKNYLLDITKYQGKIENLNNNYYFLWHVGIIIYGVEYV